MRHVVTGMIVVAGLMGLAQSVQAQGGCQRLWVERNSIYKEKGYCFNTPRGVRYFGNAGCQFDNVRDVPLSGRERERIADIVAEERSRGCN